MEATRTTEEHHTVRLVPIPGHKLDAGMVLDWLDHEVSKHPRHERYISKYGADEHLIPPTAEISVTASACVLSWADADETEYRDSYADEHLKRTADEAAHKDDMDKELSA